MDMVACLFDRRSVAALCIAAAASACGNDPQGAAGTRSLVPTRNLATRVQPAMSSMGARARRAVQALSPDHGLAIFRVTEEDMNGEDDEGGEHNWVDDGGDLPGGGQGEFAIAVDDTGKHVVVGFNDNRGFNRNPISVSGFMYSDDGGQTFVDGGQLPNGPTTSVGGTLLPQVFGDPDIKYLGDCNFIYTSILVTTFQAPGGPLTSVQTMGFHRSRDCGHTWEGPFEVTSASNPSGNLSQGQPFDAADKEFMDVDRKTGRVILTWTNFTADPTTFAGFVQMSATYSDNVLGDAPSWSPQVVIADREIDGQGSVPRFDASGRNVYVAWNTGYSFYVTGVSFARSTDGGATFSEPIDLVPDGFFRPDQVLGNDRINNSPSIGVDKSNGPHRGNVYVAYSPNFAQDGSDLVVQRSTDKGQTFGDPVFVNSRPGADRSQWFAEMAVDGRTGRAYVFYYDQGIADSGDLMQTSMTFSDNGGRSWVAPRPISARPFHGGWGNDTGQPNLGDYNMAVVSPQGTFLAASAFARPVGFAENQPSTRMSTPEPAVAVVRRAPSEITTVDLRDATATEIRGLSDRNGFLDAGETALVSLSVRNYVTNPMSARSIVGGFAVVQSATPGARLLLGVTVFPRIRPGDTKAGVVPLVLKLDPSFVSGTDVVLSIRVFSLDGAPMDLEATLHTGTPVGTTLLSENFDTVPAGSTLPAGWNAVHAAGTPAVPWTTTTTFCGTPSQAAFHVNADDSANPANQARFERLFSPAFVVPADSDYVTVEFDICTDTEEDPNFNIQAYDGFFLRVTDLTTGRTLRSVLAEAFEQGFTTDGFNGYPRHFPRSNNPNYFPDMSAWAGDSGGIQHVKMRLPGMAGSTAQLRFEFTQDVGGTCADIRPGDSCGVLVDNVVVTSVKARP